MGLIFGLFGFLLTLAVILNTVSANLHEQRNELAILRSLGITRREIIQVVLLELLIMAGIGIAIGVPLGRAMGFNMLKFYDNDFYGLVLGMQPVVYVCGIGALLAIVILAAIPGLRSVQKMDLGQVSKSQSI
jgi:putative ABC transport system permease protein